MRLLATAAVFFAFLFVGGCNTSSPSSEASISPTEKFIAVERERQEADEPADQFVADQIGTVDADSGYTINYGHEEFISTIESDDRRDTPNQYQAVLGIKGTKNIVVSMPETAPYTNTSFLRGNEISCVAVHDDQLIVSISSVPGYGYDDVTSAVYAYELSSESTTLPATPLYTVNRQIKQLKFTQTGAKAFVLDYRSKDKGRWVAFKTHH